MLEVDIGMTCVCTEHNQNQSQHVLRRKHKPSDWYLEMTTSVRVSMGFNICLLEIDTVRRAESLVQGTIQNG